MKAHFQDKHSRQKKPKYVELGLSILFTPSDLSSAMFTHLYIVGVCSVGLSPFLCSYQYSNITLLQGKNWVSALRGIHSGCWRYMGNNRGREANREAGAVVLVAAATISFQVSRAMRRKWVIRG